MSGAVNSILEVKSGRTEYILSPVFEPVWNQTGKIFAFEMLSDIRSAKDGRKICASVFFRSASPDIQYKILISQLKTAETLHKWCLQKKIMLSVNISRVVALYLRKHGIPGRPGTHIRLEVSEDFPAVALKPGDDPLLRFLSERFTLWLDDFGSGNAGLMWGLSGMFERVKISHEFFHYALKNRSAMPLLHAVADTVACHNRGVILEGVENEALFRIARDMNVQGCQGWLYRRVEADELSAIIELHG
ncbi:transcriptional regulator SfaY [Escherichia coli]|uniref:transcriptional regulator SfaY n=1 Tax=Escherichia coli TaxID=562 RepID=UPI00207B1381|nr:transcriptional regulator SfaY [Escherichia coli]MCN2978607.1 transcriptional regulator SfaY [Escherichia coli]MDF3889380.1 transcriptional regulator SfaY [Escherichia coli]